MKRVLLDENLPRRLKSELAEFAVRTVQDEEWASFANGELLGRAQEKFDVLLTADRRLQFQQNLSRFRIGVVVIVTVDLRFRHLKTRIDAIRAAIDAVQPSELLQVHVPKFGP